jgi:probable blue pigment (indigoidine) exporter
MPRSTDLALTALAPAIWGSTYLVTTELLAGWDSLALALLRALPAGLLLLLLVRQWPRGIWWARALVLGILNFSFFWVMLFISAHRLPGGVAATVGAIQPLFVLLLAAPVLGSAIRPAAVLAALAGMAGVALLVLAPGAGLDMGGIAAGLAGATAMAAGTVLTRKWQPPVSPLTFTAWQLTAGGLVLLPALLWWHPTLPELSTHNLTGLFYLGLIGAAGTYILWFRGIARLGPGVVAPLGLLSPVSAVLLGWLVLGQTLSAVQMLGMAVVIGSIVASQFLQPATPRMAKE